MREFFEPRGRNDFGPILDTSDAPYRMPPVMADGGAPRDYRTLSNQVFDDDVMTALRSQQPEDGYARAVRSQRGETNGDAWRAMYAEIYGRDPSPTEFSAFMQKVQAMRDMPGA